MRLGASCFIPSSSHKFLTQQASFPASDSATYLASVDDNAIVACFLERLFQFNFRNRVEHTEQFAPRHLSEAVLSEAVRWSAALCGGATPSHSEATGPNVRYRYIEGRLTNQAPLFVTFIYFNLSITADDMDLVVSSEALMALAEKW
jgi:hypothetical protein